MLFNKKDFDSKQRFSIRKLSVGVCSVLLSTLFLTFNEGQTVHASTDVNAADATTTSVSSNTTNNSSDNNTDKKDDSKVEASSLATAEKHAPIPIAAEVKSNKSEDQTNSASAETDTQVSKSKQAQNQTTTNIVKATDTQAATSSKDSSDTTSSKDNSAQNTVEKNRSTSTSKYTPVLTSETSVSTKANQSNSNSATQEKSNIKPVTPHADSTEHIVPVPYKMDSDTPAYVVAGSDLTNLASKFISNAAALTQSGATFSWVGNVPTATQQDAMDGNTISGTIRVTYKDGTSTTIDIESYVEARSQLQPNTFYYVNRVNDTPDFNTADANGNDFSTMIGNQYAYDPTAFSYKILGTLDTSSLGIHWANVQVTDNNTFAGAPHAPKVIGDPYVIKVPYVVQGLKLRDDIPTDANGNPVINAQLATMPKSTSATPTTPEVAFDPAQGGSNSTNVPVGLWGQYFYQDYALAYALGIKVSASNWTAPTDLVNTKTNYFAMTFNKLTNATQQKVDVNYVSAPHADDMYIYNATNKTYMTGRPENAQAIKDLLADGYMNDKVWVTLADGTKVYASKLDYLENGNNFVVGGAKSGKYNINFNASFNQKNSAGQPQIFSNNIFNTASKEFNDELNEWYQKTNNPTVANYAAPTAATWDKVSTKGISLAPTIKASDDPYKQDLTDGPFTFDSEALEKLVKNPSTGASIPSQYTLAAFSQTTPVVQVPIHQKMHFYITFHDEDSNTNLGTVEVSGSAAGNGGYDPYVVSQLKFPDGANATNYQSISTSGVPEGVTLFGDGWKSLTDPKTSWWIPNYKWENTFSVLKALTGATMTINLKHRISTTQERQTRTATVNYVKAQVNADGTYTQDGSAAQSAVLEVYYSRNKYQDQVTKVITYSPWLWDTSQGQNGYHVVSGNWTSLPTSWGAVVADVPTVDGYTAAVITDKSNQPANEFVHPTWNTAGAGGNTDPAQASQAYTKNATVYEAQPVHTVLYIPVEQQKRTVTAHMKYADAGSLTGQDVFPDEQINLIYQRTGSLDPQTNKISYGNWTWATNAGNKNTPGFEVVSGNDWANLGSEGHPQTGSWRFNAPNKQGYTTVTHAQDGNYNTEWKGQPTSTSFTNGTNTDYYWAYRNDFTVYYVPNSELSKTVTRTINITEPGKATQTVTQTATISRNSYLNNNDNGVVYSDWSTGNWSAQNVPTHEGYTMSATQTVNAVAENVQLYGNEQSPYDGHVVTFDPTNPEVKNNFGFHNVEGLTIPNFTSADFDWYDASGKNKINAPTNAGHYVLKLNDQGKQALADANKNYTFVDQNGKSTISGQITYVVTPAELVVKVTGKASKVYNNQNAKITQDQINQGDIKLVWGNSTTEPTDLGEFTLTPDDLEVVDASGQAAIHANYVDGQQTGDTYYVRLTADALAKIKQLSGAANYNISQATDTATYQIYAHKAELTLTGNQTTAYGTELPFNESKYTLDFTNWVNTNIPKPVITWQNGEMLINGQQPEDGYSYHTGDLYVEGYPDGGVPTNAGSYKVKISANLTKELQKIFPDYDFSGNVDSSTLNSNKTVNNDPVEASHEPASYVITPAEATITINGAQHVKYGESTAIAGDQYTASVTAPVSGNKTNVVTDVALTSDDLTTVPSNAGVGSYTIKLTPAGLVKIQAAIIGHGDVTKNYGWTQADNATANFFVEQMPVTIAVSGQSSVTYGTQDWLNAIKVNPSGYVLTITTENGAALSYHTVDGDLVFNQTPGNVGEYQVELSAQGLANIEEKLGTNYSYPQTAADVTAKGTFTVKQGEVTVTLNGSDGKTYNAVPTLSSGLNLDKYNVTYSATVYSADGKAQTLTLTANDLQIIGDATNVGTYQVKLSEIGQEKLKALTGNQSANYKWAFNTNADYVVKAATASAELSGSNQKTFDGTAVTTVEVNSNGQILVHFTFPGSTIQSTYALQNGDYTWSTADGNAPTNVGTYTISLNKQAILDHLQNALNTQAGLGDNDQSNVTISADDLSGQARFTINPQTLTDVTISAPDQSKTYDAQAADLDVNGITITANGIVANNPLVNPGISASDFTWYDGTGNKLESAPVDVGTYKARLNASTLAELQNANSNYQFSSVAGLIKYTINPAPATATISGSADRDYNAQTTSVSDVMNKIMWNTTGLVT